jgi:hypothetical protein
MKPNPTLGLPSSAFSPHKPIPPDHVALVRKAAIVVGAQLYEQPLSRSDFDERLYNVHIRREDGRYVCSTLPVRAFADADGVAEWLRVWAHDPAEIEAFQSWQAQTAHEAHPSAASSAPARGPKFPPLTEREAKRPHRQRR